MPAEPKIQATPIAAALLFSAFAHSGDAASATVLFENVRVSGGRGGGRTLIEPR
jgi:hypothetical protein